MPIFPSTKLLKLAPKTVLFFIKLFDPHLARESKTVENRGTRAESKTHGVQY